MLCLEDIGNELHALGNPVMTFPSSKRPRIARIKLLALVRRWNSREKRRSIGRTKLRSMISFKAHGSATSGEAKGIVRQGKSAARTPSVLPCLAVESV